MATIHIDGSEGEGGGQMVRTAAAMAARTGQAVEISNIRANRPNSGLRPQHVAVLQAVAEACSGQLEGAAVGSGHLRLEPGALSAETVTVDTGTAGSTTLILQALSALAPALRQPLVVDARGGTDTKWAPTLIHLRDVLLPTLARCGCRVDLEHAEHGFYPRGGGRVVVHIHPAPQRDALDLAERHGKAAVTVTTRVSRLPDHVAERVTSSAASTIEDAGHRVTTRTKVVDALDPGVVVDAVARYDGTVLGANALGARGVPSETVGRRCGEALVAELRSAATLDIHTADQIVPLVADVPGSTFVVREVTGHLRTNIDVVSRFVDVDVEFVRLPAGVRVSC